MSLARLLPYGTPAMPALLPLPLPPLLVAPSPVQAMSHRSVTPAIPSVTPVSSATVPPMIRGQSAPLPRTASFSPMVAQLPLGGIAHPAAQASNLKVVFEPGAAGLVIEWPTGKVTTVMHGSQAERLGIHAGMRHLSVQGSPYTREGLVAAKDSNRNYAVTFVDEVALAPSTHRPRGGFAFGESTHRRRTSAVMALTEDSVFGESTHRRRTGTVLAFGDSLTSGLMVDSRMRPYTDVLANKLGPSVEFINKGWAGEKACEMLPRLLGTFDEVRNKGQTVSHVVLLAGTNDLRERHPPDAVLAQLVNLHNAVRRSGAICIAVTVPRMGISDTLPHGQPAMDARNRVNSGLRNMAAAFAENRGGAPPLYLADLDQVIDSLPPQAHAQLFSDSVHFNERGYDLLGDVVYKTLVRVLDGVPPQPQLQVSVAANAVLPTAGAMSPAVAYRPSLVCPPPAASMCPPPLPSPLASHRLSLPSIHQEQEKLKQLVYQKVPLLCEVGIPAVSTPAVSTQYGIASQLPMATNLRPREMYIQRQSSSAAPEWSFRGGHGHGYPHPPMVRA